MPRRRSDGASRRVSSSLGSARRFELTGLFFYRTFVFDICVSWNQYALHLTFSQNSNDAHRPPTISKFRTFQAPEELLFATAQGAVRLLVGYEVSSSKPCSFSITNTRETDNKNKINPYRLLQHCEDCISPASSRYPTAE